MKRSIVLFICTIITLLSIFIVQSGAFCTGTESVDSDKNSIDLSKLEIRKSLSLDSNRVQCSDYFTIPMDKKYYVVIENTGEYPIEVYINAYRRGRRSPFEDSGCFILARGEDIKRNWEVSVWAKIDLSLASQNIRTIRKKRLFLECFGYTHKQFCAPGAKGSITFYQKPTEL